MNIIIPVIFFMFAVGLTMTVLHFSKFKQRDSDCCGAYDICPNKGKKGNCDSESRAMIFEDD
ncbi:MAG: hypothetical protein GY940_01710 [bacterium]|nr:hypothetical protein [bacterium]